MSSTVLTIDGEKHAVTVSLDTPLLWVLRDTLGMTGTKFSCGHGLCGACTVHLDDEATRSRVTSLQDAKGKKITTIESFAAKEEGGRWATT